MEEIAERIAGFQSVEKQLEELRDYGTYLVALNQGECEDWAQQYSAEFCDF